MRTLKIIHEDFENQIDTLRHASRGIVVKDNKILLIYVGIKGNYMIVYSGSGNMQAIC